MNGARRAGIYSDDSRLPDPTGSDVQRQMASLRTRLIARYRLHSVPGRPEELQQNRPILNGTPTMGKPIIVGDLGKVVSLGYGCKTIRIRQHGGDTNREWIDTLDIQLQDGWHDQVYAFLDPFFKYTTPALLA